MFNISDQIFIKKCLLVRMYRFSESMFALVQTCFLNVLGISFQRSYLFRLFMIPRQLIQFRHVKCIAFLSYYLAILTLFSIGINCHVDRVSIFALEQTRKFPEKNFSSTNPFLQRRLFIPVVNAIQIGRKCGRHVGIAPTISPWENDDKVGKIASIRGREEILFLF